MYWLISLVTSVWTDHSGVASALAIALLGVGATKMLQAVKAFLDVLNTALDIAIKFRDNFMKH